MEKNMDETASAVPVPVPPPWEPRALTIRSIPGCRDPHTYQLVIESMDVEGYPRYTAIPPKTDSGRVTTFCNIFVWDATTAMGVEIPHWPQGRGEGKPEMTANKIPAWLAGQNTWRAVQAAEAQAAADEGRPAVVTWVNAFGPGHVAMVVPSLGEPGIWIAQAGGTNYARAPLAKGFGPAGKRTLAFWVTE